jgi:putative transposase
VVQLLRQEHHLSERRACRVVGLPRSVYRYQPDTGRDQPIVEALLELAHQKPELGFAKLFQILRRQGHQWNHKRVHRIYCALKLNKRRKGKRRLPTRNPVPLQVSGLVNECWSADFMSDALWCGRRFRTFNVVDDFNREALAIEVDLNLPAPRVIRVLERVAAWRGYPQKLRLDNGPEMISIALAEWAETHGVSLEFIRPGKPMENGFIERFNRSYREAVLDMYVFRTLEEVREQTERWMKDYNEERPHESLGNLTPREFLLTKYPEISTQGWY